MSTVSPLWIKSPRYDLAFIFGGALFTLMVPVIASLSPGLLVLLFFWGWLFFFEGSHFWATYSRTYMDSKFRTENAGVLSGSLVFFALPLGAVVLTSTTGNSLFMNAYGFFIFSWSLYHNTRQHYGFVSIYNRKAGADPETMQLFKWGVYLSTFGPMAQFFLSYKLKADFPAAFTAVAAPAVLSAPVLLAVAGTLFFIFLSVRCLGQKKGSPLALLYILNSLVFYNVMFFVVAPLEPFFPGPANFAQTLLIIAVMNSLFHNIQYHAIVWHYSAKRYQETSSQGLYGVAKQVNSRFWSYSAAALLFSAFFGLVFFWRGEIPFLNGLTDNGAWGNLAYVLYFGIVGHHFYLDQKIWRVTKTRELNEYFALKGSVAA